MKSIFAANRYCNAGIPEKIRSLIRVDYGPELPRALRVTSGSRIQWIMYPFNVIMDRENLTRHPVALHPKSAIFPIITFVWS
jgi:hypothetical protein